MQHRHLLPNELDLLVDDEAGFGMAPLRAHVESCAECADQLAAAQRVAGGLDRLTRFAPSPGFANRVMAQVQVIEPWHVALTETAKGLVPRNRTLRVVMATTAALLATGISGAAVWLSLRTDVALYLGSSIAERARVVVGDGATSLARTLLGEGASTLLGSGPGVLIAGTVGLLLSGAATAVALRSLATASRRTRE
ncbi:MAG: hypothetical protein FJ202_08120 [Gemmatimonadetes bacterium]|nr:hypothetical protein [Gemmatimonadota bacterium]